MADDAGKPEPTSILHRPIPNRAMEWILIVLCIPVFVLLGIAFLSPNYTPRHSIIDLSNLRQVIVTMHAFAEDHDNNLPTTMLYTEDYLETKDVFHSRYDHEASLVFDDTPEPGWYQYGSYWFLSAPGLTLDAEDAAEIMLAYRTPRLEHEFYVVGFLDGRAAALSIEEFTDLMARQDELIKSIENADSEPGFNELSEGDS